MAVGGERAQAVVARDAVLLVHHQVVGGQVVERGDGRAPLEQRPPEPSPLGPEDLLLAEHDQAERGNLESRRALAHHHPEPLRAPERRASGHGSRSCSASIWRRRSRCRSSSTTRRTVKPSPRQSRISVGQRLELAAEAAHRARAHRDARHRRVAPLEQRQLEPLEAREQGRERRRRRRVVGRRLQQRGILQDDQGLGGQVVEQGDRRRVRRAERQHGQLPELPDRALRGGIEEAQRLHLVAEELGAHRLGVGGREDVDDAAPQAPLPDLEDRLHPLVAGRLEEREQDLPVAALADGQGERAALERLGRRHRDREPGRRRHDGHRVAVQQPAAAERALGVRLAVAPAAPGGARARGELEDAPLADRPVHRATREAWPGRTRRPGRPGGAGPGPGRGAGSAARSAGAARRWPGRGTSPRGRRRAGRVLPWRGPPGPRRRRPSGTGRTGRTRSSHATTDQRYHRGRAASTPRGPQREP